MWQVENRTPFAAERGWVRDRNGAEVWLVAVKCTFDISRDGTTTVTTTQPPPLRAPEYYGEAGQSSIRYESDLILKKCTTDVIVNGHAYAPRGLATSVDVAFRVGSVAKAIKVFGDRTWTRIGVSAPKPFTRIPLIYERAFGGSDKRSEHPERDWYWRNPVGTGYAIARAHLDGIALPNIEQPKDLIRRWNHRPEPAGCGVVASHWESRAAFAGTYDDDWVKTRQPLLPADFDDQYYQCAPQDQQAPTFLRGGETVALTNLTERGELCFTLPRVVFGFDTHFYSGEREIHKTKALNTVIIEPDIPRVSLVWHTSLSCHGRVQRLDRTVVTVKQHLGNGRHEEKPNREV